MIIKVNRTKFAKAIQDCSFDDIWSKTGSAVVRRFFDVSKKCIGFVINWEKYYLISS